MESRLTTLRWSMKVNFKNLVCAGKERDEVKNQLVLQKEAALSDSLKEALRGRAAAEERTIEFYKSFKAEQSTKMIGESLEQLFSTSLQQESYGDVSAGGLARTMMPEPAARGTTFIEKWMKMV